jgi:hypothetical protein
MLLAYGAYHQPHALFLRDKHMLDASAHPARVAAAVVPGSLSAGARMCGNGPRESTLTTLLPKGCVP